MWVIRQMWTNIIEVSFLLAKWYWYIGTHISSLVNLTCKHDPSYMTVMEEECNKEINSLILIRLLHNGSVSALTSTTVDLFSQWYLHSAPVSQLCDWRIHQVMPHLHVQCKLHTSLPKHPTSAILADIPSVSQHKTGAEVRKKKSQCSCLKITFDEF